MSRNRLFNLVFITIILVNLSGLFNWIFTADSGLYAVISKTMVTSNNWLELFVNGNDWLDKPHFPFWTSALSMKIFGVNAFGYKLPSFLFFLLSLVYTYKFCVKFYSKEVGLIAILILSSALHIIVSNNDVRAEATMLPLIMGSTYHYYLLSYKYRFRDLLLGSLLAAAAIMTKGVFILIPIFCAILGDIIFKQRWNMLFKLRWLWSAVLVLIFIVPEIWSVYYQFDLHPEKTVFGRKNVSGVKFFFWDSQFGRFFNTGPIKGKGDISFFFHTMMWAFAPWALIAYGALFKLFKRIVKRQPLKEYATLGGFTSMLVVFSLSKFQLPHYINIIFPYLSILVADFIINLSGKEVKFFSVSQIINIVLFLPLSFLVYFYFQPGKLWLFILIVLFFAILVYTVSHLENNNIRRITYYSVLVSIYIGLFLNLVFYPKLLTYQSATKAAWYVNEKYPDYNVGSTFFSSLFEFHINKELIRIKDLGQLNQLSDKAIVFVREKYLKELDGKGIGYEIVETFEDYHITRLKPEFLNPKTRKKSLDNTYLIKLKVES